MNLNYLNFFVSVANIGSINQSASELFISPQGLSRAIRQLEAEIDMPLFERDTNGMKLTPAGEKVYEYANKILDISSKMEADISELHFHQYNNASLTICAFPIISSIFLPRILSRFFKTIPDINLQILYSNHNEIMLNLQSGTADLILLNSPSDKMPDLIKSSEDIWVYQKLCDCDTVALVSRNSRIPSDRPLTGEAYASCRKVCFGNADALAKYTGFPTDQPLLKTNDYSLFRSVLSSNSYTIGFSDDKVESLFEDKNVRIVPLSAKIPLDYGVFIKRAVADSYIIREFLSLLSETFR